MINFAHFPDYCQNLSAVGFGLPFFCSVAYSVFFVAMYGII